MTWTDDELMAFADGELAGERGAALAAAMTGDDALRARVDALRRQRRSVAAAFAGVLDEPVPDRLAALLAVPPAEPAAAAPAPAVADLAAERARRQGRGSGSGSGLTWAHWGGMAASLALGVLLGHQWAAPGADALVSEAGGRLVAGGRLAQALEARLAADASGQGVAVQLSFVDRDGQYCRTFSTDRIAGLACREASRWTVQSTTPAEPAASGALRQAASPLPRALLEAVDERIAGTALTAAQERQARDRGWVR